MIFRIYSGIFPIDTSMCIGNESCSSAAVLVVKLVNNYARYLIQVDGQEEPKNTMIGSAWYSIITTGHLN
jgi:hypothetical protein